MESALAWISQQFQMFEQIMMCHTPKFQFWDVNIFSNIIIQLLNVLRIFKNFLALYVWNYKLDPSKLHESALGPYVDRSFSQTQNAVISYYLLLSYNFVILRIGKIKLNKKNNGQLTLQLNLLGKMYYNQTQRAHIRVEF